MHIWQAYQKLVEIKSIVMAILVLHVSRLLGQDGQQNRIIAGSLFKKM
ncbi:MULTISPECIES: hypothetical protein [unclassified Enterococcus]|nr:MULTISPECIES: hypothetical protein [unclassified Enterococcus]